MVKKKKKTEKIFLKRFREQVSSTRVLVISGVLFLISQITILVLLSGLNIKDVFVFQTTFSKDMVMDIMLFWLEKGLINNYMKHFYIDFINPFFYTLFLCSIIAKMLNATEAEYRLNLLLLFPIFAGAADLAENIIHITYISDIHNITDTRVFISALCANLKWVLIHISILLIPMLTLKRLLGK